MQEQQDAAPAILDTQAMRDVAGFVSSDIQDAVAEETRLRSPAEAAEASAVLQQAEQEKSPRSYSRRADGRVAAPGTQTASAGTPHNQGGQGT